MPRAVGIDVGSSSIKVCEVDGSAKKFRVTKYAEADFDGGETLEEYNEAVADTVARLFSENKLKRDQVIAALSGQDCVVRNISVPFTADEQVRKVIRFEAESHLHSHQLEDVVVDFHKTGERSDHSDVLIFAGLKEPVGDRLETLDSAGIDPLQLDLESLALFNAVSVAGLLDPESVQVILDFGTTKTNLIITDGENLNIVRTIRIHTESAFDHLPETESDGGASPDAGSGSDGGSEAGDAAAAPGAGAGEATPSGDWVVVEDATVTESEVSAGSESAEESAPEGASEDERTDFTSRGTPVEHRDFPFLHRVLVEVQRSLVRLRTERPLGRVLITGGGSLIEGLPAALEDGLQAPVEWIDLRDSMPHDLSDQGIDNLSSFGTIALGLAAKGIGADPIGVDFRQEDFRYQKAFDQVKVVLSCCVCLVALLLFVILAIVRDRRQEAERPWQIMVTEARALAETVLGRVDDRGFSPDAVQGLVGKVQAKNRGFAKKYGASGEFPPLESALDRLNEMLRAVFREARQLDGMKLDGIDIRQEYARLAGQVPEASQVDRLQEALSKSSEMFSEIEAGAVKSDDGAYTFNAFRINFPEN